MYKKHATKNEFIESDFDVLGSPSKAQRFQTFIFRSSTSVVPQVWKNSRVKDPWEDDVPVLFSDLKSSTQMLHWLEDSSG